MQGSSSRKPLPWAALMVVGLLTTVAWACGAGQATGARPAAATASPVATAFASAPVQLAPAAATPDPAETAPEQQPTQARNQVLLPTISTSPAQAASTGWNQLGGNPQRTHYVDANLPATAAVNTTWRVLWIWNGPAGLDSGPAADHLYLPDGMIPVAGNGRLYVGHADGAVRAISATNGGVLWTRPLGGELVNAGAYDPGQGAVYFASTNGRVYKLRQADGAVLGEFNAGSEIRQAVLLVGDTLYVGTMGGNLYALQTATMTQRWVYNAGGALLASAAYASKGGGLILFPTEDGFVHAVRVADGGRAWRVAVNASQRPLRNPRPAAYFPETYAVVAEAADAVIIRSYFDWNLTWQPSQGAPASQDEIRQYIANAPANESFFVLDLDDGSKRFIAPVMGGAIGNGNYYYSSPPQAVVRRLSDGTDVAYLFWRNRAACRLEASKCDGREDTTVGEMNLQTGAIRFVEDYKNQGTLRVPTDEQGQLAMVGNVLFHAHWMSMGALRIPDRSSGGASFGAPIQSEEYMSISNTLAQGQCGSRNAAARYCPVGHSSPTDGYQLDPGFYVYYDSQSAYDDQFKVPARGVFYDSGVLYWRSNDGAIVALAPNGVNPPAPGSTPGPAPSSGPSPSAGPAPSKTAVVKPFQQRLPFIGS